MKIAVASDDGRIISRHFGRTRGFSIFEVEGGQVKSKNFLENTFTGHVLGHHSEGGNGHGEHHGGHHGAILSALGECSVVISNGMGMRIYNDLKDAGKEVFVTMETDVDKAIELYLKDSLTDHPEKGCNHDHNGHGHNH